MASAASLTRQRAEVLKAAISRLENPPLPPLPGGTTGGNERRPGEAGLAEGAGRTGTRMSAAEQEQRDAESAAQLRDAVRALRDLNGHMMQVP